MKKIKRLFYGLLRGFSPFPQFIAVNISATCNRKCLWCAYMSPNAADDEYSRWWKTHPQDLDVDRFILFLKKMGILRFFIARVSITAKGEPMMNKNFFTLCRALNKYRIDFTVTTNGDYVTDEIRKELNLMKYCVYIRVSVYEEKTYRRFQGDDKFTPMNFTGVDIEGVEAPSVFTSMYGIKYPGALENFNYSTYCRTPYSFLTLYTDGTLTPCYTWHPIGNVFTDSFWKIWNGKEVRKLRRMAIKNREIKDSDCINCMLNVTNQI